MSISAPASAIDTSNIAVSAVQTTQATLVVKTDVVSDATVDYGTSPGVYTLSKNSNGSNRHELVLDGLSPGTLVYYRVTVSETANPGNTAVLPEATFHTQRPAGQSFSYAVSGDNRPSTDTTIQPEAWYTIMGQMAAENLDLAFDVGDIIYGVGSDSVAQATAKYDGFFDSTKPLTSSVPLYVAIGNHERIDSSNSRTAYEQEFTLPTNNGADAGTDGEEYYSFDNGDTHFISLCTEIPGQEGLITGNQKAWLEADLAATDKVWIVVSMHRPLFSGEHLSDPWVNPLNVTGQQNKNDLHQLFKQYGVDVVFEGHEHFYLRHEEDGILYIITGGGGAPIYAPPIMGDGDIYGAATYEHVKIDETTSSMALAAIDSNGDTLESLMLWALDLNLSHVDTYWASYSDYTMSKLTVTYRLTNDDSVNLSNIEVTKLIANNGVSALTAIPIPVPDLAAGESTDITVKYQTTAGVRSFITTTYVSCQDATGNSYTFPGPA
jgi:hypothetical protein